MWSAVLFIYSWCQAVSILQFLVLIFLIQPVDGAKGPMLCAAATKIQHRNMSDPSVEQYESHVLLQFYYFRPDIIIPETLCKQVILYLNMHGILCISKGFHSNNMADIGPYEVCMRMCVSVFSLTSQQCTVVKKHFSDFSNIFMLKENLPLVIVK